MLAVLKESCAPDADKALQVQMQVVIRANSEEDPTWEESLLMEDPDEAACRAEQALLDFISKTINKKVYIKKRKANRRVVIGAHLAS